MSTLHLRGPQRSARQADAVQGTGSRPGSEKEPASEVDSFDAFLAEKALGTGGSCYQGPTTPRRTDLETKFHWSLGLAIATGT